MVLYQMDSTVAVGDNSTIRK